MLKYAVLLMTPILLSGQSEVPLVQVFRHPSLRLVVNYPANWIVEENSSTFDAISFPPKRRPPQILVPADSGEITIGAPPKDVITIEGWMRDDRISHGEGDAVTKTAVETKCCGTVVVTVVRSFAESGIPEGRNVLCYARLNGRLLKIALLYRGPNHERYFEDVLFSMIKNLKPY